MENPSNLSAKISRRKMLGTISMVAAAGTLEGSGTSPYAELPRYKPSLPFKILCLNTSLSDKSLQLINALSPQIKIINSNGAGGGSELNDAEVVLGQILQADFSKAKKLKWVQCPSAGVERLLYPEMVNSQVTLTNAKGCYAPEIAEHVFGLLFALTRGIAAQARIKRWERAPISGNPQGQGSQGLIEMKGMTMGIVGLGGIGKQLARRAKAMDMRVMAVDVVPMSKDQIGNIVDEVNLVDGGGLQNLLATADVVVSAAPHTKRSEGMFGEKEFGLMKKGSYFINVSRGKLVKTEALVAALKNNHLAGAGLDVTDPEPLPENHPLWDMANVIITPHIAGPSQFAWSRTEEIFTENVRRYVEGLPLLNVVDKREGF